jgi:alcohol dehydrogenase, propanol-preferring
MGSWQEDMPTPVAQTAVAAVLSGPYGEPYTIQDVPISAPGFGEALVELDYSGICHGDVYARDGGGPASKTEVRPLIGGHEGVGRIVALGPDRNEKEPFYIGDVVGIAWRSAVCGTCQACLAGQENHCQNQKITGQHRNGTFQRYLNFPVSQLVRMPQGLTTSPSICPILCAGVTAYTALRKMSPQPNKWCVVVGAAGGLGHLAIQYAKVMGLQVVAIDDGGVKGAKANFCRRLGADQFVDYQAGNVVEVVLAQTGGHGADYILILSPKQQVYE